jgi:single-strand DNA-binding protein
VHFSIAVDRRSQDQDADFFECIAFGKTAEFIAKFFSKGMKIAVVGRIQNNNYKDKNGVTHYGNKIVVEEAEFCERKATQTEQPQQQTEQQSVSTPSNLDYKGFESLEDDIPF